MKSILTAVAAGVAAIICVTILSHTYENRDRAKDSVSVTGLGKRDFTSDLIVWNGSFSRKNVDLKAAYAALKADKETIENYLINKGVASENLVFSAVDINKDFDVSYDNNGRRHSTFTGYRLTQGIEIESHDVEKIESVAREVTELINQGVEFYSRSPRYYYTKLSELKLEMIASATEDATLRAENIAKNAGAELGPLQNANMGIFQIIGQNSNEDYSWGGTFNTSSKMKTATITMKLRFGLD